VPVVATVFSVPEILVPSVTVTVDPLMAMVALNCVALLT
jgi:hypothetical protein